MSVLDLKVGSKFVVRVNKCAMVRIDGEQHPKLFSLSLPTYQDSTWWAEVKAIEPVFIVGERRVRTGGNKAKVHWSLTSSDGKHYMETSHYEPNGLERLFTICSNEHVPKPIVQKPKSDDCVLVNKSSDVKTWYIKPEIDFVRLRSAEGDELTVKHFVATVPVSTMFSRDTDESTIQLSCMGVLVCEGDRVYIKRPIFEG